MNNPSAKNYKPEYMIRRGKQGHLYGNHSSEVIYPINVLHFS